MPDKMVGKFDTSNIASARNQRYSKDSFDWPKRRCTLWRNVNSRILSGIGRHFKRCVESVAAKEISLCLILLNLETIAVKLY